MTLTVMQKLDREEAKWVKEKVYIEGNKHQWTWLDADRRLIHATE